MYKDLGEAHAIILHIVIKLSHSLSRLQQGLMVMLEGNKACIIVYEVREILLMESDFNMV